MEAIKDGRKALLVPVLVALLILDVLAMSGAAEGLEPASTRADLFRDDFNDAAEVTLSGDATVASGALTLDTSMKARWTDSFTRTSIAPWREVDPLGQATVSIVNNELKTQGGTSSGGWVKAERTIDEGVFTLDLSLKVTTIGAEGFSCQLLTATGWGIDFDYYQPTRQVRLMTGSRGSFSSIQRTSFNLQTGVWYDLSITITGSEVTCEIGTLSFTKSVTFSSNVTTIAIGMDRNGVGYYDDVTLSVPTTYYGEALSPEIHLPEGQMWDLFRLDGDATTTSHLSFDILDGSTNETVPGMGGLVGDVFNISGIDPDLHPSIMLKATLYSFTTDMPEVNWWSISCAGRDHLWMEAFDNGDNVSSTDDVDVVDGRLTLRNIILSEDFDGYFVDPWTVVSGTCWMNTGTMRLRGPARVERGTRQYEVACAFGEFVAEDLSGGRTWLEFVSASGERLMFKYEDDLHMMRVVHDDGAPWNLGNVPATLASGSTYGIRVIMDGTNITFSIGTTELVVKAPSAGPFDGVALSTTSGSEVHWNHLTVTTPSGSGAAFTVPIEVPRYSSWSRLEMASGQPTGSVMNVSIVEADTLEPISGFERVTGALVQLGGINPRDHPRIRIAFEMAGEGYDIPSVDWCRVSITFTLNAVHQVGVIDDLVLVEDTPVRRVLNLTEYFDSRYTPPEEMWYNVSWRSDPDHVYPYLEGFELSVDLPEANWWGSATFKLNCSNEDHTLETEVITVTVSAVNDPPVVGELQPLVVVEEVTTTYDLSQYIVDVDTPMGAMQVHEDSVHCDARGTLLTLLYDEGGITETITVSISDGTTILTRELVVTVLQVNDPPSILQVPLQVFTEDVMSTVDLSGYILDEDTPVYDMVVTCGHPAVVGIEGQLLTFLFTTYAPGQDVEFTVSDGEASVTGSFLIQVRTVNDPPTIVGIGDATPPYVLEVDEGEELELPVLVQDEDTTRFYYRVSSDWEGLTMLSDGTLRISTTKGEVGTFRGTVEVDDRGGGVDQVEVTVVVLNVNDPPGVPVILEPVNGTRVEEGTNVTFRVAVDDPDLPLGDVLEVTWSSNVSGLLGILDSSGEDLALVTDQLPPGVHEITVTVSDGKIGKSAWITVIVEKRYVPPPGPGPEEPGPDTESEDTSFILYIIVAISAVVATAIVAVLTMLRRVVPPPIPPPTQGF